jgi:8-oxo-dGTP pyrophosphatase MutT (NUDIX family)
MQDYNLSFQDFSIQNPTSDEIKNRKVAHIILYNQNFQKYILQDFTKYSSNAKYYFLGGSIDDGETELEALERELLEESGIKMNEILGLIKLGKVNQSYYLKGHNETIILEDTIYFGLLNTNKTALELSKEDTQIYLSYEKAKSDLLPTFSLMLKFVHESIVSSEVLEAYHRILDSGFEIR